MNIFQTPSLPSHRERLTSLVAERQNRGDARASGSPRRKPACSLLLVAVFRSMLFIATLVGLTVPVTFAAGHGKPPKPTPTPAPTPTPTTSSTWGSMDEWLSMSGASVGTALTSAVLAAGSLPPISSWTLVDNGRIVSSTPDFTVAPSVGTMGGSITVNGVTYPDGTATRSLALNNSVNYTYLATSSTPDGLQQVVVNGFITFGWADLGFSGGYMDLVMLGDWISQPAVTLQLTNGNPCYCVHIETVGARGFMGRSADIAIVPAHRYSFSLLFDEINGLAKLAIFDPSNSFTQVGATVTFPQDKGSTFANFRFGNAEAGTSSGTTAYFENLMLDWTNHIFPNAPH